jgi:hypothetical protein
LHVLFGADGFGSDTLEKNVARPLSSYVVLFDAG